MEVIVQMHPSAMQTDRTGLAKAHVRRWALKPFSVGWRCVSCSDCSYRNAELHVAHLIPSNIPVSPSVTTFSCLSPSQLLIQVVCALFILYNVSSLIKLSCGGESQEHRVNQISNLV